MSFELNLDFYLMTFNIKVFLAWSNNLQTTVCFEIKLKKKFDGAIFAQELA